MDTLPTDIRTRIFSHLALDAVHVAGLVSHGWRSVLAGTADFRIAVPATWSSSASEISLSTLQPDPIPPTQRRIKGHLMSLRPRLSFADRVVGHAASKMAGGCTSTRRVDVVARIEHRQHIGLAGSFAAFELQRKLVLQH